MEVGKRGIIATGQEAINLYTQAKLQGGAGKYKLAVHDNDIKLIAWENLKPWEKASYHIDNVCKKNFHLDDFRHVAEIAGKDNLATPEFGLLVEGYNKDKSISKRIGPKTTQSIKTQAEVKLKERQEADSAKAKEVIPGNTPSTIVSSKPLSKTEADNKMKELFGSKENFDRLPVLDISDRKTGDYIDFITPGEMTAPIMRGNDPHGREFFTIRAQDDRGSLLCQTFFRRTTAEASWSSAGSPIINSPGYIIDNGKVNEKTYKELQVFINEGKNNYYTKC